MPHVLIQHHVRQTAEQEDEEQELVALVPEVLFTKLRVRDKRYEARVVLEAHRLTSACLLTLIHALFVALKYTLMAGSCFFFLDGRRVLRALLCSILRCKMLTTLICAASCLCIFDFLVALAQELIVLRPIISRESSRLPTFKLFTHPLIALILILGLLLGSFLMPSLRLSP